MAKKNRTKLSSLIPNGTVIYPDVIVQHKYVASATLTRYKRQGLIYKAGPGEFRLTRFGAESLGWQPPAPTLWERFLGLFGIRPAVI